MDPANRTVILHLVEALRACAAELRAADRLILDYGYGERAETTAALAQAEAVLAGPGSRADVLAAIHEFLHGSDDRRWRNDIDPLAAPTADAVPYWPPPCEHGSAHYAVLCVTCYRAQAADVAALRAALDTAHGRTRLNDCIERDQYRAERDRLAAENERLRADVARLDGNWRTHSTGRGSAKPSLPPPSASATSTLRTGHGSPRFSTRSPPTYATTQWIAPKMTSSQSSCGRWWQPSRTPVTRRGRLALMNHCRWTKQLYAYVPSAMKHWRVRPARKPPRWPKVCAPARCCGGRRNRLPMHIGP